MTLYRYIPVWARSGDALVLYRCFEVIGQGFSVQSKDYIRGASDNESRARLESQFLELLAEEAPEVRSPCHPTIMTAVEAFDDSFAS